MGLKRTIWNSVVSRLKPEQRWRAQVVGSTITQLRRGAKPYNRECNVCGYSGFFEPFGWPIRPEAKCPHCGSLERGRLFKLWLDVNRDAIAGKRILHFAPDAVERLLRPLSSYYTTADLAQGKDLQIDIENMTLPDAAFDIVVCSHVLEHVNDRAALSEIHRVLSPRGMALLMVPIVEGWAASYEDSAITEPRQREIHFGQWDHVRYYGADFRNRVLKAGFDLQEFTSTGPLVVKHGFDLGEKLFIATKS